MIIIGWDIFNPKSIEEINKIDAIPWTKKYLIALSTNPALSRVVIKGITLNIFNSKPNHIQKKELELKIIEILNINESEKNTKGKNIILS